MNFNNGLSGGGGAGGSWDCPDGLVPINIVPLAYQTSDPIDLSCEECQQGFTLLDGLCIKCPENTMLVNGICLPLDNNNNTVLCRDPETDLPPPEELEDETEECPECYIKVLIPNYGFVCLYNIFCNQLPEFDIDWPDWPEWDPPVPPEIPEIPDIPEFPPEIPEIPDIPEFPPPEIDIPDTSQPSCQRTCLSPGPQRGSFETTSSCSSGKQNRYWYVTTPFRVIARTATSPPSFSGHTYVSRHQCWPLADGIARGNNFQYRYIATATISCATSATMFSNSRIDFQYRLGGSWINFLQMVSNYVTDPNEFVSATESQIDILRKQLFFSTPLGGDIYEIEDECHRSEYGIWYIHYDYVQFSFGQLGLISSGASPILLPSLEMNLKKGFARSFGSSGDKFRIEQTVVNHFITTPILDVISLLTNETYTGSNFDLQWPARSWSLIQESASGTTPLFIDIPSNAQRARVVFTQFIPYESCDGIPAPRLCTPT